MKISAREYIEKVKEENSKKERIEIRPNFFYVPKLNEMMLMEKIVTPRASVSNIQLYVMKKDSHLKQDLSKLTKGQRIEYFMKNLRNYEIFDSQHVGTMLNYIDKLDYINYISPTINYLNVLKINPYYRGLGLSRELINELYNETALYGYPYIKAKMSPLDFTGVDDPQRQELINEEIKSFSPDREMSKMVDIHTLAKIYHSLGFYVEPDYEVNREIIMPVKYANIKKKDLYPEKYCEFDFHKNPDILVR